MMDIGKRNLILIVHNVRSAHNVGSLLRTADGLGLERVYLSGYTPYPQANDDDRLPHIAARVDSQIHKTALGAETSVSWERSGTKDCLETLANRGYLLAALEQTPSAVDLADFKPPLKIALIVGNEISGLEPELLGNIKTHLQIPMLGSKESFNVAVAAAIALYYLRLG